MTEQPMHILTQTGVLTSFSISKKITEKEVNTLLSKAKNKGKNEDEVLDIVKNNILQEIVDATRTGTLPGIIVEKSDKPILPIKSVDSLNHMVSILSQKLKSKKLGKLSLCYFINYLVGSLNLTEEDFEEFHRKVRDVQGDDEDDDEDDE